MYKRIFAIIVAIAVTAGVITVPAGADEGSTEYKIYWSADFDKGYSKNDTAIKDFDTFSSTNCIDSSGNSTEPPEFWDGTWQYLHYKGNYNYNARVVRRVENGNGMMSFQHTGSGTSYGLYVEKTLGKVSPFIPELIIEYKIRFTQAEGGIWYIRQREATGSAITRMGGPVFYRSTGKISVYDSDDSDNISFEYGTPAKPSARWYTVRIVYSNYENTRTTYIDGVRVGKVNNNVNTTYYKNGNVTLMLEGVVINGNTIIDIDDIKVMTECKLSSSAPRILQQDAVVTEYEYSDAPISAEADVINYGANEKAATVYIAAYGYEGANKKLLASEKKTQLIPPESKQAVRTDNLILPSGVTEIKAFIWDDTNPLAGTGTAEKAVFRSSETGIPEFGGIADIGNVSFSKKVGAASTGYTKDGLRTFMALVGTPGYVYEFDTQTGEYINSYQSGSGLQHCIKVGSDGKVYTMPTTGRDLYSYDPETGVNTLIKSNICNGSYGWHMNYGADDDRSMLYVPICNLSYATEGSPVIEYDIDNHKINVYKGFDKGCIYIHCATGDENYVYTGSSDSNEVATVSRMDKKTGEIVTYEDDQGRATGSVQFIKVIGNLIFTKFSENIVVINKSTMKKINEFAGGSGPYDCVSDPDPSDHDTVYFRTNDGKMLMKYSLKDNTYEKAYDTTTYYGNYVRFDFGRWFSDKDGNIGLTGIGGSVEQPGIFYLYPSEKKMKRILSKLDDQLGVPTLPLFFYVSRDDVLYTGGYEAGLNGFDLKTNTPIFSVENGNQHGMTMVAGKLFGGCYSKNAMYMYDPAKSVSSSNPRLVSSTSGVCRYYHTSDTNAGFGLSVGTADYGGKEGGVLLVSYYDKAPRYKEYIGIIPGENINGVAYKDGYIYAGSTVHVPQQATHEEAHVAKIEASTGKVVKTVTVNFNGLPKTTSIGEIRFGPDGLLYGKANAGQTVFALDPDDLSVVKYKSYFPSESPSASAMGSTVIFGVEGNLYAELSGDLYCINIETMEAELLYANCNYFCLDNYGNVLKRYTQSSNSLVKCYVNQRQRLETMIENASKYYKKEKYSEESWQVFEAALAEAKDVNIAEAYLPDVTSVARKLGFAIKDLQTAYDYEAGFAYPFK